MSAPAMVAVCSSVGGSWWGSLSAATAPWIVARPRAVLVGADDDRGEQRVFVRRLGAQSGEHPLSAAALGLTAEAHVDGLPIAGALWQVARREASAVAIALPSIAGGLIPLGSPAGWRRAPLVHRRGAVGPGWLDKDFRFAQNKPPLNMLSAALHRTTGVVSRAPALIAECTAEIARAVQYARAQLADPPAISNWTDA